MKMKTKREVTANGAVTGCWEHPVVVTPNNFVHKSLSNWSVNTAIGCSHGCRFCYVPEVSTVKMRKPLGKLGVGDPDADWGQYVFLRRFDERAYRNSVRRAERQDPKTLNPDGNRCIIFSSTTDPYQILSDRDLAKQQAANVRRCLEIIRDDSTLNVRILTRSPLAEKDFDIFQSFGRRLLFGMSLPTLDVQLARVYEPGAPSPVARLRTLQKARAAGLNVYVAMAPTYPECDEGDLRRTLEAIAKVKPLTVFHEPINIRAQNVERIAKRGRELGVKLNTAVFDSDETWRSYAFDALHTVTRLAKELGLSKRLHLWPDATLGSQKVIKTATDPVLYKAWLDGWWNRISEWAA